MAGEQETAAELRRISAAFAKNLTRTRALLDAADQLGGPGAGRPPEVVVDVRRAAVMLLHATMETLLRDLSFELLPTTATPEQLGAMNLRLPASNAAAASQKGGRDKVTVAELHAFRGRSVDDLLQTAINERLEESTYNNSEQIVHALERLGLSSATIRVHLSHLEGLMRRRHLIAHRGDVFRERTSKQGVSAYKPLTKQEVDVWVMAVEQSGQQILTQLTWTLSGGTNAAT